MSFTNVYYKRATGTEKSCYVCNRPTSTVLATINNTDFLYTCNGHLEDSQFASLIPGAVSKEAVDQVAREWEEKQKRKKEKEKEKDKDQKEGDKEGDKSKELMPDSKPIAVTTKHLKYNLHRDYFAMRLSEHKKRRQTAAAKDLAARLPTSFRGSVQ